MVGHACKDSAQTIFDGAQPETLLKDVRGLLEQDDFEPVPDPGDVRCWAVRSKRGLADDQHVVAGQIRVGADLGETHAHASQQGRRLALRVQEGDAPRIPRCGR